MKKEAGADVYDEGYSKPDTKYHVHYSQSPYWKFWSAILNKGLVKPEDKVLDLGCGPGQFAHALQDHGVTDYIGVDFSKVAITQAQAVVPDFTFVCEDLYKYKIPTDRDVVVILETLEHLRCDLRILRKLPEGQRFVLSVPNFDSKNHVRFFKGIKYVKKRYGDLCDFQGLIRIRGRRRDRCLFIGHGTIKSHNSR